MRLIRSVLLFYAAVALAGIIAFAPRESGALLLIGAMWLVIRRHPRRNRSGEMWGME